VLVENCAAIFDKAVNMGAKRCIAPTELPGSGVYATIYDVGGTELSFWQAIQPMSDNFEGSGQNPFMWLEKPAPDLAGMVGFYANLLGWDFTIAPGVDDFAFCDSADRAVGIGLVSGERGALLRGNTVYVRVSDCEATCKRAKAAGGSVHVDAQPSHSGVFAVIVDPSGNPLAITQPA
jgi:predicted enzyme related to lactoylglutathione lyase